MKKLFLTLIAGCILCSACNQSNQASGEAAATTVSNANAPIMKFESESHDFGKIKQGDKVTYDFKFTNVGKTPLIITDAQATCGCTKPEFPKAPVKPGESAAIHVTFDSAAKTGLQDKMITVTANTNPPQNRVHLIGEVLLPKK